MVWLILILCLLVSAIKYTLALILKWSVPGAKIRKDYAYLPAVSVLMPCYNEGKTVYETIESISKSNYPNDRFEVIAQDDCSVDDSHQWMLRAQRDFTNIQVRVGRNDENSGKARTVCNALLHSTGEIIISIDSDCIFHPDAIRELTACFSEPKIGSVGGRVGIRNPNASAHHRHPDVCLLRGIPTLQGSRELDAQRGLHQRMPFRHSPRTAARDRTKDSQRATGLEFPSTRAKTAFSHTRRSCTDMERT